MNSARRLLRDPCRMFVLGVWLALTGAGLAYAARYALTIPTWDDFKLIPVLSGEVPCDLEYLWAIGNGHRTPLQKLLLLGLIDGLGVGWRGVSVTNFLAASGASLILLLALGGARGCFRYTDAVVPLVVQGFGPAVSLLRPVLLTGMVYVIAVAAVLALLIRARHRRDPPPLTAVGGLCLLLALTDSRGVLLMVPLAAWVLAVPWLARSGHSYLSALRQHRTAVAMAVVSLAYAGLTIAFFRVHEDTPIEAGPGAMLVTAVQALGQCFGPAGAMGWTETGFGGGSIPVFSIVAVALVIGLPYLLVRSMRRTPASAPTALGLVAMTFGLALVAAAIGVGRASIREGFGLQNHYGVFFAPLLLVAYVTAEWTLRPRWRRATQTALLCTLCALSVFHLQLAVHQAKPRLAIAAAFERDAASGVSLEVLVERYVPAIHGDAEDFLVHLERMKRSGLHPFPAPPLQEE